MGTRRVLGLAVVLVGGLLLTSCTSSPPVEGVSTLEARLGPVDGVVRPGALSFRVAGLIDTEGADRPLPDIGSAVDPAGDGQVTCSAGHAIAVLVPITGDGAGFGVPIRDAALAAVTEFVAANPGCRLQVKEFDTGTRDPGTVAAVDAIAADRSIVGVIGPVFSHEVDLVGDRLTGAGLAFASPSATSPTITDPDSGFFRGLPNEEQGARAAGNYLTRRLGLTRICVVAQDLPETELTADVVRSTVGEDAVACSLAIGQSVRDYDEEIGLILEARPEAVYFAGYSAQAAAFVKDLHSADPNVLFVGWEGVLDGAEFVGGAADSGRGTLVVGSFLPTTDHLRNPAAQTSVDGWSRFATEAYELTAIMTQGVAAGVSDRAAMWSFLDGYAGNGPIRRYGWDDAGELSSPELLLYEVG